jgi:hypothetical protein
MSTGAARLEIVAGNAVGMMILVEDELLIGRNADGAGRLADDDEISRSHARLTMDASGFCAIEDLGSTNGTFVNGLRISGPRTLSVGDSIELGNTTLVVRELPALAPDPAAPQGGLQPTVVPRVEPPIPAADLGEPEAGAPGVGEPAAGAPEVAMPEAGEPELVVPGVGEPDVPPMLSLQLEVDYANREARLILGDGSEPVRLVFEAGTWRATTNPRATTDP